MNYWKKERYKRMILQNLTVTNGFLLLQIILFLLMTVSGGSTNPSVLVYYGAKYNPYIVFLHQYWRFMTPIFLHIGLEHVLMNSIFLYFLGNQLESIIGSGRFFIIYLLSGIIGNVASFAFSPSISAGASTSLFGLFGIILYLSTKHGYIRFFKELGMQYKALLIMNLASSFLLSRVDLYGHIGGLVGGYLATAIFSFSGDRYTKVYQRVIFACLYAIVFMVLFFIGTKKVVL